MARSEKRCQPWPRHEDVGQGLSALARGPRRDDSPAWCLLPGTVERPGALGLAQSCRMRAAWRAAGEPHLVGLWSAAGLLGPLAHLSMACFCGAVEVHLALGLLLLLGAGLLVIQKDLHSLG